jgi:hypothetical protein
LSTVHYPLSIKKEGGQAGDNFSDAAKGEAVRLIVVVQVAIPAINIPVVTVRIAVLRTRPVIPVGALIVQRPIRVTVANGRQEYTRSVKSSR